MSIPRTGLCLFACTALSMTAWAQPGGEKKDVPGERPLPDGARLRLGNTGLGLADFVTAAALSPDGKLLAVGGRDGISLFERGTNKLITKIGADAIPGGLQGPITFSPSGELLAFGTSRSISLAGVPSGKVVHDLVVPDINFFVAQGVSFSADGKTLAFGGPYSIPKKKSRVLVWDVADGKMLHDLEAVQNAGCWAALSADGKTVASWGRHIQRMVGEDQEPARIIQLWDVAAGKERHQFKLDGTGVQIKAVALAPDGKSLAVASGTSTFHIFDLESGKEIRRFAGRRGNITHLHYSADGKLLVAGAFDGTVQAWHAEDGKRLNLAAAGKGRLHSIALPKNGPL